MYSILSICTFPVDSFVTTYNASWHLGDCVFGVDTGITDTDFLQVNFKFPGIVADFLLVKEICLSIVLPLALV